MRNLKKTIAGAAAAVALLSLAACQEPVVVDLDDDVPRLVVEGTLDRKLGVADSAFQTIRLTLSSQFYDQSAALPVSNATVRVRSADGLQDVAFVYNAQMARYETHLLPMRAGVEYTTSIEWEGDTYISTGSINPGGVIDSLYYRFQQETRRAPEGIVAYVDFTDPAEYANSYQFRLYKNGVNTITSDGGNARFLLRTDDLFNGQTLRNILVNDEIVFDPGDTITLEVAAFDKRAYDFYFTAYRVNRQGGQFGPPAAPLPSNVGNITAREKHPLGYIAFTDVSRRSVVVR